MPNIHLPQKNRNITVNRGAPLMESLLSAGIPVASSCGGDGICGKCRVIVLAHPDNLSPPQEIEIKRRQELNIPIEERLSCQVHVLGSITIETPYW